MMLQTRSPADPCLQQWLLLVNVARASGHLSPVFEELDRCCEPQHLATDPGWPPCPTAAKPA